MTLMGFLEEVEFEGGFDVIGGLSVRRCMCWGFIGLYDCMFYLCRIYFRLLIFYQKLIIILMFMME